jgi:DNA uptake protein ComE-like DNA-binding protein
MVTKSAVGLLLSGAAVLSVVGVVLATVVPKSHPTGKTPFGALATKPFTADLGPIAVLQPPRANPQASMPASSSEPQFTASDAGAPASPASIVTPAEAAETGPASVADAVASRTPAAGETAFTATQPEPAATALSATDVAPKTGAAGAPAANPELGALPSQDVAKAEEDAGTASASATRQPDAKPAGPIDLNTAPVYVLDHLPGVGRIGRAIVRHRPYHSVEDLVDRRVLRSSDFQRVRSLVTVQ